MKGGEGGRWRGGKAGEKRSSRRPFAQNGPPAGLNGPSESGRGPPSPPRRASVSGPLPARNGVLGRAGRGGAGGR